MKVRIRNGIREMEFEGDPIDMDRVLEFFLTHVLLRAKKVIPVAPEEPR